MGAATSGLPASVVSRAAVRDLEERFGQTLDDFLATGQSPEPVPTADWVWKVRVDSLHHARRHFNKTPELYALYKESLAWRAAERAPRGRGAAGAAPGLAPQRSSEGRAR